MARTTVQPLTVTQTGGNQTVLLAVVPNNTTVLPLAVTREGDGHTVNLKVVP